MHVLIGFAAIALAPRWLHGNVIDIGKEVNKLMQDMEEIARDTWEPEPGMHLIHGNFGLAKQQPSSRKP